MLPIVLRLFTPAEVALWQVFATLIGLQMLAEVGFNTTFTRLSAYALGGAEALGAHESMSPSEVGAGPNWLLLRRILALTRLIYGRLSWLLCLGLLFGGTVALVRRVQALDEVGLGNLGHDTTTSIEAWLAWALIVVVTTVGFRSNSYVAFLQGTNHVALFRRWEALFGLGAIVTSVAALLTGGGLLALVLSNQVWVLLSAWRNRWLVRQICDARFHEIPKPAMDTEIFAAAWGPAWRAGMGAFMSFGLIQISGLIYAQSRDSAAVASYLLGLRLVQTMSQISQAPFYSKLPVLSRLWGQGKVSELVAYARRGMTLAYWAFVLPFIVLGLLGPSLLELLGSEIPFPSMLLWGLLGAAFLCERYGAMHLQLYSTTNHIVWHIANGVTGLIFIFVVTLTYAHLGVIALPIAMLAAYLSFYTWYCSRLSHRKFSLPWPWFDLRSVAWPAVCLTTYLIYAL